MKAHVILTLASLLVWRLSLSAGAAEDVPPAESGPAESAARKADAEWTTAAHELNIDAWLSFYALDAIVLLPQGRPASGTESVRQAVSRLLALPRLSVAWRQIEAAVTRSGDLVMLTEAYELRYDDSNGVPLADRGRRLVVWSRQTDGSSKCVVDTWDSAVPAVALQKSRPTETAARVPAPARDSRDSSATYGAMPTDYETAIRDYFLLHLKHAESVQYRDIGKPVQGYTTEITSGFLMREKREYGWTVKATINAKDSHDTYVGFKTYTFLFRGEEIVDARLPFPGDEMN
jgi:ketosteroid isomerase-like protein